MKKVTPLILFYFALLLPSISVGQINSNNPEKIYVVQEKNPATSFILSSIIPGTGQMYNGQVVEGIVFFLGTGFLYSAGQYFYTREEIKTTRVWTGWGNSYTNRNEVTYPDRNIGIACFVLGAGAYLYQVFQAPLYTKKKNMEKGFVSRQSNSSINLAFNPIVNGLGLYLRF